MRIRNLAIASVAVMALAMPARADLVLLFLDSPTQVIDDFVAFGNQPYDLSAFGGPVVPAVPALNNPFAPVGPGQAGTINMQAGTTRIIQLAMLDTVVGNVSPPPATSSIPASGVYTAPRWLTNSGGTGQPAQTFGMTLWETRVTGTVIGPVAAPTGGAFIAPPNAVPGVDPDNGNHRASLVTPLAAFINAGSLPPTFTDFGGLLATGAGAAPNYAYGTLNGFPQAALGGRFALFNFQITVPIEDPGGVRSITVSDRSIFNDFEARATGAGGVGTAGDRIPLDSTIFSALHPNYVLNVNVTPIPEPSSMVLAGMALTGLGYKLRRKMKAKAQATA